MLSQLKGYIQNIINTGVTKETPWSLTNKIQITNALLVITMPFILFNVVVNIFQQDIIGFSICCLWTILALIIILQNKRQKHTFNFFYIVILITLVSNFVLLLTGPAVNISPMYAISILMTLFFFDKKKYIILLIGYVIFNYLLAYYIVNNYDTIVKSPTSLERHLYFFVSILIMIAITLRVLQENKNRIKETEKLLKQVEKKNTELERFTYIASHDLKEPIRNIGSFSSLLERKLKDNSDKTTQEYLSFIKNSAIQLNVLMDSVLDFMNISNAEEHEIVTLELSSLVIEASQNIIKKIEEKNAYIKCTNSISFQGIKYQLLILLEHLIDNGIKFNENENPKIIIEAEETAKEYIFKIKDNGIGIEESYHKQIFIPFKTLHNKSYYDGAGVGLSICQRIAEHHNGYFSIESTIGKGSTFCLSIPNSNKIT
ncbi:MAG: sensor histidine kinase [Saprospiraceae bacterium]